MDAETPKQYEQYLTPEGKENLVNFFTLLLSVDRRTSPQRYIKTAPHA